MGSVDLNLPITRYGGKIRLARRIAAMLPQHRVYGEPFFGSGAVLFAKAPSEVEVANDLDRELTNFWRVLQNPETLDALHRRLTFTPYSEVEFNDAVTRSPDADPVTRAAAFMVACMQSFSADMRSYSRSPRHPNNINRWVSKVDRLPEVYTRLRHVQVWSEDAVAMIRRLDAPDAVFYCDPPYLHETRVTLKYKHEMTDIQHAALLNTLATIKGKFLLSGYPSRLYDDTAARFGWSRMTTVRTVNVTHVRRECTDPARLEVFWANYPLPAEPP